MTSLSLAFWGPNYTNCIPRSRLQRSPRTDKLLQLEVSCLNQAVLHPAQPQQLQGWRFHVTPHGQTDGDCGVQDSLGWIILPACNKTPSAQHPHACCLWHMVWEETNSYDLHPWQLTEQSTGAKRGLSFGCLWSGDLVMNTPWGARLARKWGKVRVTKGGSTPPLLAPLFSPFAPTAESIVHVQCHLGLPPLPVTISRGTYV